MDFMLALNVTIYGLGIVFLALLVLMVAIMILGKPENRDKLIFFMGIEHVRFRKPVYAGDQVIITATVKRLRSRMGWLHGVARVNGEVVDLTPKEFELFP